MKNNSKSIREAIDANDKVLDAMDALVKSEDRDFTEDEATKYDELVEKGKKLYKELATAEAREELRKKGAESKAKEDNVEKVANRKISKMENKSDNEKQVKERYGLYDAARALYSGKLEGLDKEMHQEGVRQMNAIGKNTNASQFSIAVPSWVANRATITENNTTGIEKRGIGEGLHAMSILNDWATIITGIEDFRLPFINATTVQWEGETDAAADGGSAMGKLDLTPTRLATYVDISKQAIMQHGNDSLVMAFENDIRRAVSAKLDYAIFTDDTGAGGPTDIKDGKTPVTDGNVNELAFKLVEEVLGNNAFKGNLGFVISHTLLTELMTAAQVSGVSGLVIPGATSGAPNLGTLAGHPLRVTSQAEDVASNQEAMYFGNWAELFIAQFGATEILFDPFTQAVNGTDRLVLNSYWDFGLRQSASISVGGYTGTDA